MKNVTLPMILGGVSLVLLVIVLLLKKDNDLAGPVIEFSDECVTVFTDEDEVSILLKGVSAKDKKDGDVTESLRIQNVIVLSEEEKIIVHYSAKDKDNNIGQIDKKIDYNGTKEYINVSVVDEELFSNTGNTEESRDEVEPSDDTSATDNTSTDENSSTDETTDNGTEENTTPDNENTDTTDDITPIDKAEVDRTGIPQIRLKYHEVTVKVGEFYFMDAFSEWYDDKDDVTRRVIVVGEYDVNVPGIYELTYYVTDTDLNVSNKEKLTLTVTN